MDSHDFFQKKEPTIIFLEKFYLALTMSPL